MCLQKIGYFAIVITRYSCRTRAWTYRFAVVDRHTEDKRIKLLEGGLYNILQQYRKTIHIIGSQIMAIALGRGGSEEHVASDQWVWDKHCAPADVKFSSDLEAAYFHVDPVHESTGTVAVRGTKGFEDGMHYWEIVFLEPPAGTSVMVGVGTRHAVLSSDYCQYVNLIGVDKESWGLSYKGYTWHDGLRHAYCEPFFDRFTIIGCHLDMYRGTLAFSCNGKDMGVAFSGLPRGKGPLYPIVSSTATETELQLGIRTCRYLSLQGKCLSVVKNSLKRVEDIDKLPLPECVKQWLREW